MTIKIRKLIVRLRMWYADIRGHHGMRWNYESSEHYMGIHRKKKKWITSFLNCYKKWHMLTLSDKIKRLKKCIKNI
tara:strand:+ start:137 stop:364 length:228 start_codon:yes stop_codon:yes gene_type:complete